MNRIVQRSVGSVGLLVLTLFLVRLPAQAATPAEYDAALAQVQAALRREADALRHGGAPIPPAQAPAGVAARVLTPITVVERPGQSPQTVDDLLLVAALRSAEGERDVRRHAARLESASGQIAALRRELTDEGATRLDPTAAQTAARAVLSGPVYGSDPLPPPSLFDRFIDWLGRSIERLLRSMTPHRAATMPDINPGFIRAIVIVLGVGAFGVLVAVLVQWLRRRPARVQPLALDETEAALVEARDTDSLRALAEQKAQGGDYRLALRFIYLALLVALDSGGVLRFDRSKTNWEYLRALRASGRGDVYDALTPLTRDFDRIWYGFATADAADYVRALTQYDAMQAAPKASTPGRTTAAA